MTKKKPAGEQKKRGRKKITIDYQLAEKLSNVLCTISECAAIMGVSEALLHHDPKFLQIHKKGIEGGKASLRRSQYLMATDEKKPNATMLIWLGKQYLSQADKIEQELTGKDGTPIASTVAITPASLKSIGDILAKQKV